MTRDDGDQLAQELNTTNLVVTVDSSTARAAPGELLTYRVAVVNAGPNPSSSTLVTATMSGPGAWVDQGQNCRLAERTRLQCELGELLSQVRRELLLAAVAGPESGLITISASAENRSGPEADVADNVARADTRVGA